MVQKFFIRTDTLIKAEETKDAETGEYVDDCDSVKMTICDGKKHHLDIATLSFRSGGTHEIIEGDIVLGASSGAQARVSTITLDQGNWANGDAQGRLGLLDQFSAFTAGESLDIDLDKNVATTEGDSSQAVQVGGDVWLPLRNHGLKDGDSVLIDGSRNYDGIEVLGVGEKDRIRITAAFVAERFTGEEDVYRILPNGNEIVLTHVGGDDAGYYDGILPKTIDGLIEDENYYLFIVFIKNGIQTLARVYWKAVFYPDEM